MTKIEFTEPSSATLTSNEPALEIKNTGVGGGIFGECTGSPHGEHDVREFIGVRGKSTFSAGVKGESQYGNGIKGVTNAGWIFDFHNPQPNIRKIAAVVGISQTDKRGYGIAGFINGESGAAVYGQSVSSNGEGVGVHGSSYGEKGIGVSGICQRGTGVVGMVTTPEGIGILGRGTIAGRFEGDVEITGKINGDLSVSGDIKLLNPMNADCAEDFDILDENVEPGTVMVLTEDGSLQSSHQEYDKKVAGVISGAGGYKPAMVLGRRQESLIDQNDKNKRLPIALMGKVYCKVDARYSSIETGDLLTTSSIKGHAMKVDNPTKAFGAVIGKALGSIRRGVGMIPVLVTLQ